MANWFPMALKEPACSWIMNLPEASITSWGDLCEKFVANFRGTYERPLTKGDLQNIRQCPGETLRKYIQRLSQTLNQIPRITTQPSSLPSARG